jgi:hypothetical protein
MSDAVGFYMVLVSEILSALLLIRLWLGRRFGFLSKLFWSLVLLIPVLGPIFYLGFSQFPSTWPGEKTDTVPDIVPRQGADDFE